jgi:outer membrane protein OmpA-like peptidoglycan-associated protein
MSIWKSKFRNPALVAGVLAISLATNPAFAKSKSEPRTASGVRGGVGFTSGALIGAAAGGPLGAIVGATIGATMGERSQKKNEVLVQRRAEAALLASEVDTLNRSLTTIEGRAGQVGASVQFRTGETGVRDNDRARLARLGALVAGLDDVRVRVSGYADSRGNDELNLSLSKERAEMVARELEKAGIPKERLIVEAMGERFASTDAIADDQAFERSVEIRFESGTALASN